MLAEQENDKAKADMLISVISSENSLCPSFSQFKGFSSALTLIFKIFSLCFISSSHQPSQSGEAMQAKMDDGEIEISDNGMLRNRGSSTTMPVESLVDELLKNTRTCTHTHSCNPPGPDSTHTHTCFHTHTQVLTSEDDGHHNNEKQSDLMKLARPSGNREAVRKYREKKKARTAYLEEEVTKLHQLNQQLVKKLQGQVALEAEALRLRNILIEIRGKIDIELGDFPMQKHCNSATTFKEGDCRIQSTAGISLQCQTDLTCFHSHTGSSSQGSAGGSGKVAVLWDRNYQHPIIDCSSTRIDMLSTTPFHLDAVDTLVSDTSQAQ